MYEQPLGTVIFEVTGFPLPDRYDGCLCGSRIVDLRGYLEHDNLRPSCTACGAALSINVAHSELGGGTRSRGSRYSIKPSVRFNVFRRDKYCCVHCGRPAPRAGAAFEQIRTILEAVSGSGNSLVIARNDHAASCVTCGQMLPGILQSIPYAVVEKMTAEERELIFGVLEKQRLTIDHLFPVAVLEIGGVVRGGEENRLVTDVLLATSCMECNWGRRDTLEAWGDLETLLNNTVLRDRINRSEIIGYAKQIYFRAHLELIKSTG
jgi:hypothetical protein